MFDSKMLSASIRKQKKKMLNAEPSLADTDSKPDLNPMDLYNVDKRAQMEETIGSPKQSDASDSSVDDEAQQMAASHEPMESHVNPKDHHKMAYGGAVEHGDPMMPSPEMERKYVGGSPESNQEMARRFSNKPSIGKVKVKAQSSAMEKCLRKSAALRCGPCACLPIWIHSISK